MSQLVSESIAIKLGILEITASGVIGIVAVVVIVSLVVSLNFLRHH